jgi:hypothetical protein
MDLVPYKREHLDTFEPGENDIDTTRDLSVQDAWIGKAVSIQEDGRTLAITGFAIPKVGETTPQKTVALWAVLSDDMRSRPIALCRMAKASLREIWKIHKPDSIVVEVDLEFTAGRRWAEWLGFVGGAQNPRWSGQNREMKWQPKHL